MDDKLEGMFDRLEEMVNDASMNEGDRYNILDYIEDIMMYIVLK